MSEQNTEGETFESTKIQQLEKTLQEFRKKTLSDISGMDKTQLIPYIQANIEKIDEFRDQRYEFYYECKFKISGEFASDSEGNNEMNIEQLMQKLISDEINVEQLMQKLISEIDYKNEKEQKEIMKNDKEKIEIKLKIIENIVQLKTKIQDYKKLSKKEQGNEREEIIHELQIVKKLFEETVMVAKDYLSKVQNITNITHADIGQEIGEKILSKIDAVDSEALSISILQELFNLHGFQNLGNIKTYLSEGKSQEENERINILKSMNIEDLDRHTLEISLKKYGDVSYDANEGMATGPILVIFPEMHYARSIIVNNTEAILGSISYYNFIATEGHKHEIKGEEMYGRSLSKERIMEMIDNHDIGISSDAIEGILKEVIKTIGVEPADLRFILTSIREKYLRGKIEDKNMVPIDSIGKKFEGLSYRQIFENSKKDSNEDEFFKNVIVTYRNYFWLKNIQNELIQGKIQGDVQGKNFIPIICGAVHVDDLVSQSKSMGFKGVMRFSPKALDQTMDPKIFEAYVRGQMK